MKELHTFVQAQAGPRRTLRKPKPKQMPAYDVKGQ